MGAYYSHSCLAGEYPKLKRDKKPEFPLLKRVSYACASAKLPVFISQGVQILPRKATRQGNRAFIVICAA
ncbi:hypothetical protein D1Z90_16870 [Motilimonas pumila]|uniref:Uncharacterized protein n=1 Tax=Motilimonas pumila TaxID=2303987 RepID=A0A418YB64_9GAMM|nr:hypothetical protein D1Z90_16870 [Motilimonas pumila]